MSDFSNCSRCGGVISHNHHKNDDKIIVSFQLNRTISVCDSSHLSTVSEACPLCEKCHESLLDWFRERRKDRNS